MCREASFVLTKDRVFWSMFTDSHEDIIKEFELSPMANVPVTSERSRKAFYKAAGIAFHRFIKEIVPPEKWEDVSVRIVVEESPIDGRRGMQHSCSKIATRHEGDQTTDVIARLCEWAEDKGITGCAAKEASDE